MCEGSLNPFRKIVYQIDYSGNLTIPENCLPNYPVIKPLAIILTGPPGSGKTTIYKEFLWTFLPIDVDLESRQLPPHRRRQARTNKILQAQKDRIPFVFMTAAPTKSNKDYWLNLIDKTHTPLLFALIPPILLANERHLKRKHNTHLTKGIQEWYKRYERHPREIPINSPDPRGEYGRLVGLGTAPSSGTRGEGEDKPEGLYPKGRSQSLPVRF